MNEKDYTQLDQYFNGELSPQEAEQVLARAGAEPDFAAAFAFRKDQEEFLQREEKRQALTRTLETVGRDFFLSGDSEKSDTQSPVRSTFTRVRLLALAAAVALLIAAIWFFSRPGLPEYSAYARHEPLSLTVRGQNDQAKLTAQEAFNAGKYAEALTALDEVLKNEPGNITAQFSRGICLLETGQPAAARAAWEPLANGNSALKGEARWEIALSYLYEKNWSALKSALHQIEPGADHFEEAQKLLKSLP